ncbi:MAG: hypothetical protein HYV39_00975 [Candidatus Levybacteria bacterium]|nr:hypothetical protein [Candidatus Levybacteria bacterium]
MTTEARPSRFGPNHTPPPDFALDRLKGVFRKPTLRRLLTYGDSLGIDPDSVFKHVITQYPEKTITELVAETRMPRGTFIDMLDFAGIQRRTMEEVRQRNKQEGKGVFGMTREARQEAGRNSGSGIRARDNNFGVVALTKEQRVAAGKKGASKIRPETGETQAQYNGRRSWELKAGFHAQTREQRARLGIAVTERMDSRKAIAGENYFDSYAEAATAMSLEQFVPEYQVARGDNYQVILESAGIKVDFLVGDVLVEYNPIVLKYLQRRVTGFDTQEEYELYMQNLSQLDENQQVGYTEQVREGIAQRYFQRRRRAIDQDPGFRDRELIVATTPGDLYDQVITRFGENYPNRDEFIEFFNATTRTIRNENRRRRRRENQ